MQIVEFLSKKAILTDIKSTKKEDVIKEMVDLLITDNYDLLRDLKSGGFINFIHVAEAFYDKLVYIPITDDTTDEDRKIIGEAIFFKTSITDKEIIDSLARKVPSVFIQSSNVCKQINALKMLYSISYNYLIVKESVAKKCDFSSTAFFDNLYNLYYVAIIVTNNFQLAKKTFDFLGSSKRIKEIIRQNGYSS